MGNSFNRNFISSDKMDEIIENIKNELDDSLLASFILYGINNGVLPEDIPNEFNEFVRDYINIMKYGNSPFEENKNEKNTFLAEENNHSVEPKEFVVPIVEKTIDVEPRKYKTNYTVVEGIIEDEDSDVDSTITYMEKNVREIKTK